MKPCPFCGKQPDARCFGHRLGPNPSALWVVDCLSGNPVFHHVGCQGDSEAEARANWNSRGEGQAK